MLYLLRGKTLCLTIAAVMVPQLAFAAAPTAQRVIDVALHDGGVLNGRMVDAQGQAMAGSNVALRYQDHVVANVQTDAQGNFAVQGLRGGMYQVESAAGNGMFRVWSPKTAPPSAHQAVLFVGNSDVVRGQCDSCGSTPCCCGGGVGIGYATWAAIGLGATGTILGIVALADNS